MFWEAVLRGTEAWMSTELEEAVADTRQLQNKVVLLVGPSSMTRRQLEEYASKHGNDVVHVGARLAQQLTAVPKAHRQIDTARIFRRLVSSGAKDGVCLCANLEVLFDRTLAVDPLLLLRQCARADTIVAQWPGAMHAGRLQYATVGHAECRDLEPIGVRIVQAV